MPRPFTTTSRRRRAFARWLAALMLCVALGPLVSAALLGSAEAAPSASCIEHAGHGMPCDDDAQAPASASGGHCPLCLVLQHPPLLDEAPAASVPHGADRAPAEPACGRAAPHDRAQRWVLQRMHAPPPRG